MTLPIKGSDHSIELSQLGNNTLSQRNEVYKLWYEIYYQEMGRNSQYADHINKLIKDELEPHSHIFMAKINGITVGTFRVNLPEDGGLSYYQKLYRLDDSKKNQIAIGTKYMVHSKYRGNYISHMLMSQAVEFLHDSEKTQLIIDCNPCVYKLFKNMGFTDYLNEVIHREYGKVSVMEFNIPKDNRCLYSDVGHIRYNYESI